MLMRTHQKSNTDWTTETQNNHWLMKHFIQNLNYDARSESFERRNEKQILIHLHG